MYLHSPALFLQVHLHTAWIGLAILYKRAWLDAFFPFIFPLRFNSYVVCCMRIVICLYNSYAVRTRLDPSAVGAGYAPTDKVYNLGKYHQIGLCVCVRYRSARFVKRSLSTFLAPRLL